MSARTLDLHGQAVQLLEEGEGEPLLYLHGFADVHGVVDQWLPFHEQLLAGRRLIAPAHPGCADSGGIHDVDSVEDVVLHYAELVDALGLARVDVVGTCVGGWLAAEFAVRYPDRVRRLVLVGATGLHVPGAPIGDLFMLSQAKNGGDHHDLRALLFAQPETPPATELFPNGRASVESELLRYQTLTFAGRIGWHPPYLYDRKLRGRLRRIQSPSLVVWGRDDRLVPLAHAHAYAEGLTNSQLVVLDAGHCVHLEQPVATAAAVTRFLDA